MRNRRRAPRRRIYERARRGISAKSNGINGAVDAGNSVRFADPADVPMHVPAARRQDGFKVIKRNSNAFIKIDTLMFSK